MTAMIYALSNHPRQPQMNLEALENIDRYWQVVRSYYAGVDSKMASPNTTVFQHEMPGGQYSNLRQQATAVGLGALAGSVPDVRPGEPAVWRCHQGDPVLPRW